MNDFRNETEHKILGFTLDELAYAIPLKSVVRVIHALEIRHLPGAPEIISGIINIQGQIIPVIDIRRRFGLPVRETNPDDRLIIADTGKRRVAMVVDFVTDINELESRQFTDLKESFPASDLIKGVAKINNEIILIYDLERFLSLDEENVLNEALNANK